MDKAFQGIRIIECGNFISAPYCGKLLADLGAEAIKVEPPKTGDRSRHHGPFPGDKVDPEKSGLFMWLNAGKRSITLDLRRREGRQILRRLVRSADVLIENYPPATAREMGLSNKSLSRINPRLIQVSITAFGQTGPYRDYKAYHINCCAAGGVSIGIGSPDREPLELPMYQADFQAGVSAASAVLIALIETLQSGQGQYIDVSAAEVLATLHTGRHLLTYIFRGVSGLRRGNQGEYFWYPNCVLPCKDGYVALTAPQLQQWLQFVEMMGKPGWTQEPRYRDRRVMHEQYPEEVDRLVLPWLATRTKNEVFAECREKHVPFAPVYSVADLAELPHLIERDFFKEIAQPGYGKLKVPGSPFRFSAINCEPRGPAPKLGQNNEDIYSRLGYSKEDLAVLSEQGVI